MAGASRPAQAHQPRLRALLAAIAAAGCLASLAQAQVVIPNKKDKPDSRQPTGVGQTGPGSAGTRGNNQPIPAGKIIDQIKPHDWTLQITLALRAPSWVDAAAKRVNINTFDIQSAAIVFPVLIETGSSTQAEKPTSLLRASGIPVPESDKPEMLQNFHSGTQLAKWKLPSYKGDDIELELTVPLTAFETIYNDAIAEAMPWSGAWPAEAASTFQPQAFIDVDPYRLGPDGRPLPYDMEPVKALLKNWTDGKDPKSIAPAILAKFLAGQVLQHVQISGNGLVSSTTGELEGFGLKGAPETARTGIGSEFDMVCLLAAVYRSAGLPARTVIGIDSEGKDRGKFLAKKSSTNLRAWVEFPLVDSRPEGRGKLVWVPVDIVRMRKSYPKPPPLERPWSYFGSNKELDDVAPIAFQFIPPTTVVSSGAPAFYGWLVSPQPPQFQVLQILRINSITTPKRGNEPERRKPGEEPLKR
jgi:hypothetical protein